MRHQLVYLPLLIVLLLGACQEDWDKHYLLDGNEGESNASGTIWEAVCGNPEYSEFVTQAKECGLDSVLRKEQQMTLWVPNNAAMVALGDLTKEEKVSLLDNHINYVALKANRFFNGQQVKTLAGKNVFLSGAADAWMIDGQQVEPDVALCNNGVVHEVKGLLVPRQNIFEYLSSLGDEYSIVRDTLVNSCIKTFRPDLSFPLGVDEVGNTVYDSVFIYESKLLAPGDIREENKEFTLFLPDNEKIRAVYEEVKSYYPSVNDEDSVTINNWIFRALIYEGKIGDYTAKKSIRSTFGREWRTDIQRVDVAARKEFSNGYVYPIDYFRIPHFLFLKKVETYPIYYKELKQQQPELIDEYFAIKTSQPERTNPEWDADKRKERFFAVYDDNVKDGDTFAFEWTSIDKNRFGDVVAVPVVPGRYKLSYATRAYGCGNVRVTVNGVLPTTASGTEIPYFNAGSSIYERKAGEIGYITIPETNGVNPVRIRLEAGKPISDSFSKRIVVHYMVFEPDGDNY